MNMRPKRYEHVKVVVSEVHDGLLAWCRRVLRDAGLEAIEVYGQFPPEGTTSSYVVLFPYRLGPAPKVVETAHGLSLIGPQNPIPENSFVPNDWIRLGVGLGKAVDQIWPRTGKPKTRTWRPHPAPLTTTLPKPLKAWYEAQSTEGLDAWLTEGPQGLHARLPSLWWRPGYTLTTHYMAVANDGGRGTSDRTNMQAPLSLPGLSVIASGLHLERVIDVELPPMPCDPKVFEIATAFGKSVGGEVEETLAGVVERLQARDSIQVALIPVHDLTNMDFANLMQALQRPLQPALNLAMRMSLGAFPILSPSVAPAFGLGVPESHWPPDAVGTDVEEV